MNSAQGIHAQLKVVRTKLVALEPDIDKHRKKVKFSETHKCAMPLDAKEHVDMYDALLVQYEELKDELKIIERAKPMRQQIRRTLAALGR